MIKLKVRLCSFQGGMSSRRKEFSPTFLTAGKKGRLAAADGRVCGYGLSLKGSNSLQHSSHSQWLLRRVEFFPPVSWKLPGNSTTATAPTPVATEREREREKNPQNLGAVVSSAAPSAEDADRSRGIEQDCRSGYYAGAAVKRSKVSGRPIGHRARRKWHCQLRVSDSSTWQKFFSLTHTPLNYPARRTQYYTIQYYGRGRSYILDISKFTV